jgi:hypothetical protein
MDLLEPRGSSAVKTAGSLAEIAQLNLDKMADDYVNLLCTVRMARARTISQKEGPAPKEIDWAIQLCEEATNATSTTADYLLLRGRTEAMRGILLRKMAKHVDKEERIQFLENVIDVLTRSYEDRRSALTDPSVSNAKALLSDPDHHVDRGWFNLGGAYIEFVNAIRHEEPERLPWLLSQALKAYAGSLFLRQADDDGTLYAAASYYGVALSLYMAAIHCPGEIDVRDVDPVEELDPVRQQQTTESLLRAAERLVMRSLDIRADIDGPAGPDSGKSRALHRKISLAWTVAAAGQGQRLAGLASALRPFLNDIDLTLTASPVQGPPDSLTVTSR